MKATVLNNQSILDIAIQTAGSAESAFDLALENDLSSTGILQTGEELKLPLGSLEATNRRIADYYAANRLKPATGVTGTEMPGGINYMGVEIDFIVS